MSDAPAETAPPTAASGMELAAAEVGAQLRLLSELDVTEHVAVFEQIHSELHSALSRLDVS